MESGSGYWRLNITTRLKSGVASQSRNNALERIVDKSKKGSNLSVVGGDGDGRGENRLFPLGEIRAKSELSTALQNSPRKSGSCISLFLDFDAICGRNRGNARKESREYFGWGTIVGASGPN